MRYRPTLLIILDGWGISPESPHNAITLAAPKFMTDAAKKFPFATLEASGESVGLPKGLMGNSEVGHLNLGAGRIVYQDIVRIGKAIQDGSFFKNEAYLDIISNVKKNNGKLHLIGLVSDGGVHSSFEHLIALIRLAKQKSVPSLYVHPFLDGRDTPPRSALKYIEMLENNLKGIGKIATVSGRYYAMDRDKRWDRLEKAYRALVLGEGPTASSAKVAIEESYARGESDEFVLPTIIASEGKIQDGDGVIFFNFRADRARQLTRAFTDPNFSGFKLPQPKISFCSMTRYESIRRHPRNGDDAFNVKVAFPPQNLKNTISEVWSREGLKQFHTAETEKYAHVTYFFGGGREEPFPGEDRLLIPSQKVATYDLKPEMSAGEITKECLSRIDQNQYDCIVLNFANADMVGHTGNIPATVKAVQFLDRCIHQLVESVVGRGGLAAITADHGNAEMMFDLKTNQSHTAHTTGLVPFICIAPDLEGKKMKPTGILADVAPTLLALQNIPVPSEMTGRSLFKSGKSILAEG